MKRETKDSLGVISACVMLIFGISLTAIGFAIAPLGEVSDSVLWILGQSLIYAGGIFGIASYTKGVVDRRIDEWKDEVRKSKESEELEGKEA